MNKGYTQAVGEKKLSMAHKMGLSMNGGKAHLGGTTMNVRSARGMKYEGHGKDSGYGKGMKKDMHGKGGKGKLAEKPIQSEKHTPVGNSIYTQAAK